MLVHERIDYGFAMLAYVMANLWSKDEIPFRRFLPPWYEVPLGDPEEGFRRLLDLAERRVDADDLHPHR